MYSQDYGLEFLAKAKPLRPRPRTNITAMNTLSASLAVSSQLLMTWRVLLCARCHVTNNIMNETSGNDCSSRKSRLPLRSWWRSVTDQLWATDCACNRSTSNSIKLPSAVRYHARHLTVDCV